MTRLPPRARAIDTAIALTPDEIAFVRGLVIHEDAEVLALNKPAGLSSQGGRGQVHTLDELMWAFVKPSGSRPRLVHRLDRDTSGVILTARSKPAAGFLGKALMARRFRKTYVALVGPGAPEPGQGEIKTALRREEVGREAYMRACAEDHADAEAALTRYRTLAVSPEAALVELEPVTGRMHQLRVHLATIGVPIVGDVRYGGSLTLGGRAAPRLMLHAARLRFPHPAGGETVVEAPWPGDFAAAAETAGLYLPSPN
jgi:tRNA pseudouridine32 synthase/23S rRNA pseudouridine746 synthase